MANTTINIYDIEELPIILLNQQDIEFSEGDEKLVYHMRRERNARAVKIAKERFKRKNQGRLFCQVCSFDFSEKYGDIGEGFIEAHHTKPISEMQPGEKTRIDDFLLVCSNCHSMLHVGINWITHEELALRLRSDPSNMKSKIDT